MLTLNGTRKSRISNRLAIFAALLLAISSLAGVGGSAVPGASEAGRSGLVEASEEAPAALQAAGKPQVKKNKGFKVSLFLFRNG